MVRATERSWDFETSRGGICSCQVTPEGKMRERILIWGAKKWQRWEGAFSSSEMGQEARGLGGQAKRLRETYPPSPSAVQGDTHLQKSHLFFPAQKAGVTPLWEAGVSGEEFEKDPQKRPLLGQTFFQRLSRGVCTSQLEVGLWSSTN